MIKKLSFIKWLSILRDHCHYGLRYLGNCIICLLLLLLLYQDYVSSETQTSSSPERIVETDHLSPQADLLMLLKLLRAFSNEGELCACDLFNLF